MLRSFGRGLKLGTVHYIRRGEGGEIHAREDLFIEKKSCKEEVKKEIPKERIAPSSWETVLV